MQVQMYICYSNPPRDLYQVDISAQGVRYLILNLQIYRLPVSVGYSCACVFISVCIFESDSDWIIAYIQVVIAIFKHIAFRRDMQDIA